MRFCRDEDNDGWFWVDRDLQGHVDHFEPCDYCRQLIEQTPMQEHEWRQAGLCDTCLQDLDLTSRIDNMLAERPWDLDTYVREIIKQDFTIRMPPHHRPQTLMIPSTSTTSQTYIKGDENNESRRNTGSNRKG